MQRPAWLFFWAALCLLTPAAGLAQTTGTLRGLVVDIRGDPLAGVTIAVSSGARGIGGRGAVTGLSGLFQLSSLPPAKDYAVGASLPGFATVIVSDVEVSAGRPTILRIILQPESALRQRVEVRARPQAVNLESTTSETTFSTEFIDALPLLGRNYQDILALAPGVTDIDGDGNPNIHGARDTAVVTLVDGVSTNDPLTGKVGAQINIESIQEIEIKTSGATAEFSRAQGGFANIITKSGGNDFRGAFKFLWRGRLLDGDGAGIDDPRLHAGVGRAELRDLRFNDFLPFLSLEGPIAKDHAWFFLANEYIQVQEPVNAVNTAFVSGTREYREFLKLTWQANANNRLALSVNYDPQEYQNQGLNSFTSDESGFTDRRGGTVVTLKGTTVLNPYVALETSASSFNQHPARIPNLDADVNGNGILFYDRNGNGFHEVSERDVGEDYDGDGHYDVFEPVVWIDATRTHLDYDGDGLRTPPDGCEGFEREDVDCDGYLDRVNEDTNGNGLLDWDEIDFDSDRRLDLGTEDRNNNLLLDDTPFPASLYPYGRLTPVTSDRDYTLDRRTGVISGPYYQDFSDQRRRITLRQDLSVFVPDFKGSHDLRTGFTAEREVFDRRTDSREILAPFVVPYTGPRANPASKKSPTNVVDPILVSALLPVQERAENEATGMATGFYVQDSYKPAPNLSLGMGVRLDREVINSSGYTPFDPAPARAQFDRLNALIGTEATSGDLLAGDNNGITSFGVLADPIFFGAPDRAVATSSITDPIRRVMPTLFLRNHADALFGSNGLASIIPDITRNGQVDPQLLEERGVEAQKPQRFTLTNSNLAPRLSASWDPASAGKTKLFATWGRYFDRLFLSTVVGEEGPDWLTRYYKFDNSSLRNRVEPNRQIGGPIVASPPSAVQVDRGLQTPFSDELTAGFEREIAPEVALSVTYIDRRYRRQLQDIDVNHYLRIDPATGQILDVIGRITTYKFTDFGGVAHDVTTRSADGRPDLYVYNPYFNQILRIGNFNEARYKAIEVAFKKRLARRWAMQASYVYSRAVGDAEDFQSRLGNDPSTIESEFGYLEYDQRHVVKVNATTFLPHDWQLGASLNWSSGLPYSVVSRFFALDNLDYQQFRTRFGYTRTGGGQNPRFIPVTRNGLRNDPVFDVNVHTKKALVIGRTSAALFLDVFNLLNTDDLRISTYEPTPDVSSINLTTQTPRGPLEIDATRRFGRRFQVGLQIEF